MFSYLTQEGFFAVLQISQIKRTLFKASGERLHRLPAVLCGVQLVTELRSKGQVPTEETWYKCRKINSGNREWEASEVHGSSMLVRISRQFKNPSSLPVGGDMASPQVSIEGLLWQSV